jgi:hypothetical protein
VIFVFSCFLILFGICRVGCGVDWGFENLLKSVEALERLLGLFYIKIMRGKLKFEFLPPKD